jgi:hypothetical protein
MAFLVDQFKAQKHVSESFPAPSAMSQKLKKWKNGVSGQLPDFQVFDPVKYAALTQQRES